MVSPLATYGNLSLLFQVPVPEAETLNRLGSPSIETAAVPVLAYGRESSGNRTQQQDGELARRNLKGFYLAPISIPGSVAAETVADAIEWDISGPFALPPEGWADLAAYEAFIEANAAQIRRRSKFVYAPTFLSPFGVDQIVGQKLEGYLITEVAWGDPL